MAFPIFNISCHVLTVFSCIFTSSPTFPYIWINLFQTSPALPQGLMVKKCMCFDLRRDSNPHPSYLLTFFKLFLTRTLIFLWVSWENYWGIWGLLGPFELVDNPRSWDFYKAVLRIYIIHISIALQIPFSRAELLLFQVLIPKFIVIFWSS